MNLFWAIVLLAFGITCMVVACMIIADQTDKQMEEYWREQELDEFNIMDAFYEDDDDN